MPPAEASGSAEPRAGDARARVSAEIAERWNGAGVRYAVVHGLEGFPQRVGRDLDVLVHHADVERALALARERLEARGWMVTRPPGLWGERLVAIAAGGDGSASLEVHTLTRLVWASVVLAARPQAAEAEGPFRIDPWAAFAKRILMPLLAGDTARFAARPSELGVSPAERAVAAARLTRLCGARRAQRVLQFVEAGDLAGLRRAASELRFAMLATSVVRAPLSAVGALSHKVATRVGQHLSPCAPVFAIVGGNTATRTAVLDLLREHPPQPFLAVRVRRWPGGFARDAGVGRWLGHAWFAARRLGTHWWRDAVAQSHQQLVVYDGGAFDATLPTVGEVSPVSRLLPKLDLVVRLGASGADAPTEGPRALDYWRRASSADTIVCVTDDPARAAREVGQLAVQLFIGRHAWRGPGMPDEARAQQVAKSPGSL